MGNFVAVNQLEVLRMTKFQKGVATVWGGLTAFSALAFVALVLVLCTTGCDTNKDTSLLGVDRSGEVVASQSFTVYLEDGVKALVIPDRDGRWIVNGVTVKVIMVLDYACGFIGPIPAGHGRDCTDTDTPSDEPPTARYIGDPTSDD